MIIDTKNDNVNFQVKIRCIYCRHSYSLIKKDDYSIKCLHCGSETSIRSVNDLFGWITDVIKRY